MEQVGQRHDAGPQAAHGAADDGLAVGARASPQDQVRARAGAGTYASAGGAGGGAGGAAAAAAAERQDRAGAVKFSPTVEHGFSMLGSVSCPGFVVVEAHRDGGRARRVGAVAVAEALELAAAAPLPRNVHVQRHLGVVEVRR